MADVLDVATRASDLARGLDGWALAILGIVAAGGIVVVLWRSLESERIARASDLLQMGHALSRSAEALEQAARALREQQTSVERLTAELQLTRQRVDTMAAIVDRCRPS